jgi:hypothetical protein
MKSNNENDDGLINILMEETYQSIGDDVEAASPEDLLNYYHQHENSQLSESVPVSFQQYVAENNCSLYEFEFRESSLCFRLKSDDVIIDFPSNWSVFSDAKEALELEVLLVIEVSEETDQIFYEVMNDQFFHGQKILLAHFDGEVHFLGFENEEKLNQCLDIYQSQCEQTEESIAA